VFVGVKGSLGLGFVGGKSAPRAREGGAHVTRCAPRGGLEGEGGERGRRRKGC